MREMGDMLRLMCMCRTVLLAQRFFSVHEHVPIRSSLSTRWLIWVHSGSSRSIRWLFWVHSLAFLGPLPECFLVHCMCRRLLGPSLMPLLSLGARNISLTLTEGGWILDTH